MKNKYVLEVINEYGTLRDIEELEQKERQREIYNKIPRIKEIDEKISGIGFDIASSIFKGGGLDTYISAQKKLVTDLKIEKAELLASSKYPVDYLEIKYKCSKCKDTGYIGTEKCSCFRQKLIDKYYQQSNLKDIIKKENFDTFDISLYSPKKYKNYNISPLENMKDILTYCINFANNFNTAGESLFFSGSSGLGKTFLSNCIAKDLLDRGKIVIYQTASNLIEILRSIKFDENTPRDQIDDILNCDLLVIDDLGTEPATAYSQSEIFNIINERILRNKKMIISTNILIEDLFQHYPERITSRIFGHFRMFEFYGDDIRVTKSISKRKSRA